MLDVGLSIRQHPISELPQPVLFYLRVLSRTFASTFEHHGFGLAKGAAYSALLSFFPVLTSAGAVLAQTNAQFVSQTVSEFLFEVIPPGTEDLVRYQFAVKGQRPILLLIVAAALSTWAASGVVRSLMEGFRAAYHIEQGRPFFRNAGLSMLLVLLSSLPLLAACGLMLFGGYIDRVVVRLLEVDPLLTPVTSSWHLVSRLARYGVAFAATVGVTTLLYYFGPARRQRWTGVWRGGVLATALWLIATAGFGWYVRNLANYNVLYGSVGTSIALLVWMYLMSLIALLGCEFNAEYERATE
jgi:membrane protein